MAFIQCDFISKTIGMRTSMNVILPEAHPSIDGGISQTLRKYPTLYLLHGISEDHTSWHRFTSIERYAEAASLAVVMPAVHRSFYTNGLHSYNYWNFISQELPLLAQSLFPLSSSREENFVAGASMGGYGAFKLALTYPDRYAAAASLAGAVDLYTRFTHKDDDHQKDVEIIFGSPQQIPGSDNDLLYLAEKVARSNCVKPSLYMACGTEDPLYQDNLGFKKHLDRIGLEALYEEGPGGHTWEWWDAQIDKVIHWLSIRWLVLPSTTEESIS